MEENNNLDQQPVTPEVVEEVVDTEGKGFAIAALVLGIISVVCCCIGFTIITAIIGVIIGVLGIRKANPGKWKTMAIVATIISGVGLILSVFILVFFGAVMIEAMPVLNKIDWDKYMKMSESQREIYLNNLLRSVNQ